MPRYFAPCDQITLKQKIDEAVELARDDEDSVYFEALTPKIEKDLNKVSFNNENTDYDQDYDLLTGYHTLENGMTFFGVNAGGDWEYPILYIIYWDGYRLRGYIPKDGNPWNTDTYEAYGNDDQADTRNARKRWPSLYPVNPDDPDDLEDFEPSDMAFDKNAVIADIMARIKVLDNKR